jgi:hypothetical protein
MTFSWLFSVFRGKYWNNTCHGKFFPTLLKSSFITKPSSKATSVTGAKIALITEAVSYTDPTKPHGATFQKYVL